MLFWNESRAALAWCERSWNTTVSQGSAGAGDVGAGVACSRTGGEGQPTVDRGPLNLMEPCIYWALSLKRQSPQRTSQIRLDVLVFRREREVGEACSLVSRPTCHDLFHDSYLSSSLALRLCVLSLPQPPWVPPPCGLAASPQLLRSSRDSSGCTL